MKKWLLCLGIGLVSLAFAGVATAADKVDPTGTWKWSMTFNDQTIEQTLTLKLDGEKLTGALKGRQNQETAIENAKLDKDQISFTVTRERNGMKRVSKYSGTVTAEEIKGKIETERDGQTNSRDWVAKKQK